MERDYVASPTNLAPVIGRKTMFLRNILRLNDVITTFSYLEADSAELRVNYSGIPIKTDSEPQKKQ